MTHSKPDSSLEMPLSEVEAEEHTQEIEINLEDIEPPIPPDGGWGWVVLVGSFMCMFFVDGLSFSFGIILADVQESFQCSTTTISLAGSFIVGFTLISGPIVSAISNVVSFRILVWVGSLVSFCSILTASFVYDVYSFIILYGVITGISFGLIYLPSATIVTQWFAKRRATATGISVCGSSIGSAVYSIIIPRLVKLYSWRGCMAIMAAFTLNCFAAGFVFFSVRDYQRMKSQKIQKSDAREKSEISHTQEIGQSVNSDYHKGNEIEMESGICNQVPKPEHGDRPGSHVTNPPAIVQENQTETNRMYSSNGHLPPVVDILTVSKVVEDVVNARGNSRPYKFPKRHRTLSVEPTAGASIHVKYDQSHGSSILFTSSVSLRPHMQGGVHVDQKVREEIKRRLERETELPVNRADFFYTTSMARLNEFVSSHTVDEYVRSVTRIGASDIIEAVDGEVGKEPKIQSNSVIRMLSELFDVSLLGSPTFAVLLASSVFGLLGYPVPYMFLSNEAQGLGFTVESSANLLVYLSAVNTVGRIVAGVISDWPCTDALLVNNAALITAGIACMLLPILPTYAGHVAYAVTFGLSIAAFVSLRIILLVEMLGLDRLTNAYGFLLLFQGVAYMASSPILAAFYDAYSDYRFTFLLGGGCLIISGIMCIPLRVLHRWEKKRNGETIDPIERGCFFRCIRLARDHLRH
nr:monocarboxylate transporter [Hymenolepis microstoma]